jgi:DNA polymerase III epsilon subunit-like protein
MNFKKDILLIDTEFSGFDLQKHEMLQLAAILLDKKTLREKKKFNSYISPTRWEKRDRGSMAVNKITLQKLKGAPKLSDALKAFEKAFGHDVIQAFYVGYNDKRFLMESYRRAKVKWRFDYHYFDLWPVFYVHLAKRNLLKSKKDFAGFGLESLVKMLKIKVDKNKLHDALVDCRLEAEIFRKLMLQK